MVTSLNRRRKRCKTCVGLLMTTADCPSILTEGGCARLEWTSQTAVDFSRGKTDWHPFELILNWMNFVNFACKQMASLSDCSRLLMYSPLIHIYKMLLPGVRMLSLQCLLPITCWFVWPGCCIASTRLWIYNVCPRYHYFSRVAM